MRHEVAGARLLLKIGNTLRCRCSSINSLRPRRNRSHLADDIFKRFLQNENVWISIKISLKFVHKGPINNIPAMVQIMAWRRPGDKPLSEPMMVSLPTHICVARPQWVLTHWDRDNLAAIMQTYSFLYQNFCILFTILLKIVPWNPFYYNPVLV